VNQIPPPPQFPPNQPWQQPNPYNFYPPDPARGSLWNEMETWKKVAIIGSASVFGLVVVGTAGSAVAPQQSACAKINAMEHKYDGWDGIEVARRQLEDMEKAEEENLYEKCAKEQSAEFERRFGE
jgi:hypothetical protein